MYGIFLIKIAIMTFSMNFGENFETSKPGILPLLDKNNLFGKYYEDEDDDGRRNESRGRCCLSQKNLRVNFTNQSMYHMCTESKLSILIKAKL